jgi:hypothetical protein
MVYSEAKIALECFKRRNALEEHFRRVRIKSGKAGFVSYILFGSPLIMRQRTAYDDQAYYNERQALDLERADHSALSTELRTTKAELERMITRQKRLVTHPQHTNHYHSGNPACVYAHHYSAYYYLYAQTYGALTSSVATTIPGYPYSVSLSSTVQYDVPPPLATSATAGKTPSTIPTTVGAPASTTVPPSLSTAVSSAAAPAPNSLAGTSNVSSAIPMQLPVSWFPRLHALGIVPIPTESVSADGPRPPAVLCGTSANGAMLNLEINVSLLQAAEVSGLALMLNSIMRGTSNSGTIEGPPLGEAETPGTSSVRL